MMSIAGSIESVNYITDDDSSYDLDLLDSHGDWQLLQQAVFNMDVKNTEDMIKQVPKPGRPDPNRKSRTLMHDLVLGFMAAVQDDVMRKGKQNLRFIDILTLLVQHGVSVNVRDRDHQTALHLLSSYPGHSDVLRVLLATGCKVNLQDRSQQTALHIAVVKCTRRDVETLLDGGADPNLLDCTGHSSLHLAVKRKFHTGIVRLLLQSGADPNSQETSRGRRGSTPLHVAVKHGYLANIRALLVGGSDVNLHDASGQLPVHIAATHEMTGEAMSLLHKAGASLNSQDTMFHQTALHKAVTRDMVENFNYLVRHQADPNLQDAQRETALHLAAASSSPLVWCGLMTLGGNAGLKNRSGLSPMDKAHKAKNQLAVAIMKQYGAKNG